MGFHPQTNSSTIIIKKKKSDKFKLRDILQNVWSVVLKTDKVIKNKGSLRNCYNQKLI